jgi:hypothetical protein
VSRLATFNRWHAARVIHSRTCVMIVLRRLRHRRRRNCWGRDGALKRRCRRIVWLNPMIGWDGYAPEAAGIKAALPHVDLFAPAHTLESLPPSNPIWRDCDGDRHDRRIPMSSILSRTSRRRGEPSRWRPWCGPCR